jgi:hypothetical protein
LSDDRCEAAAARESDDANLLLDVQMRALASTVVDVDAELAVLNEEPVGPSVLDVIVATMSTG